VTPETGEHLDKARECLARAEIILGAGVGEDAGRDAYLAGFHAAQALILAGTEDCEGASGRAQIICTVGEKRTGASRIFALPVAGLQFERYRRL
jgi:uncharacterized protein (UPF0332 family)